MSLVEHYTDGSADTALFLLSFLEIFRQKLARRIEGGELETAGSAGMDGKRMWDMDHRRAGRVRDCFLLSMNTGKWVFRVLEYWSVLTAIQRISFHF